MTIEQILQRAASRGLMPIELSSRDITDSIAAEIRERSLFIARGANLPFLVKLAKVLADFIAGRINAADARLALLKELQAIGYTPEGGFPDADPGAIPPAERGTIRDISSTPRLQLILDTQAQLMFGAGQKAAGETPSRAYDYPAWELIRISPREVPRGFKRTKAGMLPVSGDSWPERWAKIGGELIQGRMIALKGDLIWAKLGDSSLFNDALDTDRPPFAFNSGVGWKGVSRKDCISLRLIDQDWKPEGFRAWRLNEDAKIGAANIPRDILFAAREELKAKLEGSKLRIQASRSAAKEAYLSRPNSGTYLRSLADEARKKGFKK